MKFVGARKLHSKGEHAPSGSHMLSASRFRADDMASLLLHQIRVVSDLKTPRTLFEHSTFRENVLQALDPDIVVDRYNRAWRLSQPQILEDRWLWGRLGFALQRAHAAVVYNEETHDFELIPGEERRGTISHYVLDLESQYMLFEEVRPEIRRQSFVGAMESILGRTKAEVRLTVEEVYDGEAFSEWVKRVDRITRFRATFRRPNPDWDPRFEELRKVVEDTNADTVSLEASKSSSEDQGLVIHGTILEEVAEHAAEGYGDAKATGKIDDKFKYFDSRRNPKSIRVPSPQNGTISAKIELLKQTLKGLIS